MHVALCRRTELSLAGSDTVHTFMQLFALIVRRVSIIVGLADLALTHLFRS
ncbi:unnamed protein product [Ixodes pacificus]